MRNVLIPQGCEQSAKGGLEGRRVGVQRKDGEKELEKQGAQTGRKQARSRTYNPDHFTTQNHLNTAGCAGSFAASELRGQSNQRRQLIT